MAAGTTDVARLVLQVEASVELARRNMRELAAAVDQDAGRMDAALGRVEKSHTRMGQQLAKTGQFRGGMQQLGFQINDVASQMAVGTKASVIFAQQSGQVIQALQLMTTSSSGFLKFLAGPWGVVLSTATVVLASLGGKLFETEDAVGGLVAKMREQAQQAENNRRADELWRQSIEGVTEAIRKRREEQEKSLATDIETEQKALRDSQKELSDARDKARDLARDLAAARRDLAAAENAPRTAVQGTGELNRARVDEARAKVEDLQRQLNEINAGILRGEQNVRGAETVLGERRVERQLDKSKDATDRYTEALARLRNERKLGLISQDVFDRKLLEEQKKRDAAIKAAQAEKTTKSDADTAPFINPVTGGSITGTFGEKRPGHNHAGVDLAVPVGSNVSAAAAGTVIEVGNLPGYGNVVIIDHGRGTTTRYAHLSKFMAAKGDQVGQGDVIGLSGGAKGAPGAGNSQGPHVHFEVRRGGKAVDPRIGKFPIDPALAGRGAVRSAQREVDRTQDQDDAFASAMQDLERQALQAQMELVQGIDAQADLARDMVDAEQKRFELAVQNDVNDGRLREEQGKLLIEKSQAVATQRKANIEAKRGLEKQEDANRTLAQETDQRIEALRYAEEIARTQDQARSLQLQIIDAMFAQKEADLRLAKAKAELAGKVEDAARIQDEIDEIPTQRARAQDGARRDTMNPMEEWADGIPQTAAEINEAFQQINANALDGLADGIAGVIAGTQSMGDAFRSLAASVVADIARMIAKMLIMKALQAAMGGFGGGVGGAGGSAMSPDIAVTGLSSNPGSIFGAAQGMVGTIGGRGGIDQNVLSINGRPALRVSKGETLAVIPQMPNARVPAPANSNVREGDTYSRGGDTYHVRVEAPNTGDPRRDRASALQQGAAFKREIARTSERGQ